VAKTLLREVVPQFGLPLTIHSNNGPAFVAEVTQTLTQALGISWKLHTAYQPTELRKVELMNRTSPAGPSALGLPAHPLHAREAWAFPI
jgi:hypothetical protein